MCCWLWNLLAIFKELARKNVLERRENSKHGRKHIEKKSYLALQSIVSEKSGFHEDVLYASAVLDESERDADELPLPFMHASIHGLAVA